MSVKKFPLLPQQEMALLDECLHFMKMAELKKACGMLRLPEAGKKVELIKRIMTYVSSGDILETPKIPSESRAKNYPKQPLHPNSLMLYGGFKHDADARALFKQLIGPHFHFTAFGIDWLNERWQGGNPPTYQEFATFWQLEMEARKKEKAPPKKEWALINFALAMKKHQPEATRDEIIDAWKAVQAQQAALGMQLLKKCMK